MAEETVQDVAPETPAKWYGDGEFSEDQISVVNRYKDRSSWNKAHFELRRRLGDEGLPPDPSKLKPEEYLAKLKDYRARAGGIVDPKGFKIVWPADIAGYVEGKFPETAAEIAADAAEFGLTQMEVDAKIAKLSQTIRDKMQSENESATQARQAKDTAIADAVRELTGLWGDATETNTNNATLKIAEYDNTLYSRDNEGLSEEEIADRGGKLAQFVRDLPPDKRNMMLRLFNNLHVKESAESGPTSTIEGQGQNLFNDRFSKAKQMWPNRGPEWWNEAARSNMQL
jgi:hypothetical protein